MTAGRIIPDTSVVMPWYFRDEANDYSDRVAAALPQAGVLVPIIWPLEIANAIVMGERRKRGTSKSALEFLEDLTALLIDVDEENPLLLWPDIFNLSKKYRLTAYDACYLELALREKSPLATLDKDLKRAAHACGVEIFMP